MNNYLPGIQYKEGTTIPGGGGTDPTAQIAQMSFVDQSGIARQRGDVVTAERQAPSPETIQRGYTTLSTANVENKYLPELQQNLQQARVDMAPRRTYTDQAGFLRYQDDSSMVQAPLDSRPVEGGGWESQGIVYGAGPSFTGDKTLDELTGAQMKTSHAATNRLIQQIKDSYGVLINQQKETNRRFEQERETALMRAGSARYSPLASTGAMEATVSFGAQQVAQITSQMNQAVSNAEMALANQNYTLLSKAMSDYSKQRDERMKVLEATNKRIIEESQKLQEQRLVADEVAAQGETATIASVFGKLAGKVPVDTIKSVFGSLTTTGTANNLKNDLTTFQYLEKNNLLPSNIKSLPRDQQYLAYLNMQALADKGKLSEAATVAGEPPKQQVFVGAGAENSTEEAIIRMRLFSKLMNVLNKGALSDADRKIIDTNISKLRNDGLSEQEILSRLSGLPSDVKTPYNAAFVSAIGANSATLEQQNQLIAQTGNLLGRKEYEKAMVAVENAALANARKLDPETYMGQPTAEVLLARIQRVKDLFEKGGILGSSAGGPVGVVSGTFNQLLGRLKGPEAAKIQGELRGLYQEFRRQNAGVAVTDSESKYLQPLFAEISDRDAVFMEKLNLFEQQVLDRYNATRSSVGLPAADTKEVINKANRLKLYETADPDNFWQKKESTIFDPERGYIIPSSAE